MHSIEILQFVNSRPGGVADLKTIESKFGQLPRKQLDYLVQLGLLEYLLDYIEDDLEIVGYEITAKGLDLVADRSRRQKLNQRRKQQLAYQQAEREWRDALDRADKSQDAREARQHGYLVAVLAAVVQVAVEKLPNVLAVVRKLLGF